MLTFVTDAANDTAHPITLHMTANGANLSFAPGTIDFGTVPTNNTASAPLNVVNDGNQNATVTLTSTNNKFSLSPTGPNGVDGGISLTHTATFAPGVSVVQESAAVSMAVDSADVLCAPLPAAATLIGLGTTAAVSYTPVALDFGNVNCGTIAAAKTVVFKNGGNQDYTITSFTLGRDAGSPFTVAMVPATGIVPYDGGTVVITATPKAIPATSAVTNNLYGDVLTVTTNVPADVPHDIQLRETARGSIFAISIPGMAINYGSVAVGANAGSMFTVTNSGNAAGLLNFTTGQPASFQMPTNAMVPVGNTGLTGNFTPLAAMGYTDTSTISAPSPTVLCQPLPFTTVALSGTGSTGNVVGINPSSLSFGTGGMTNCGMAAGALMVTVTNNSTQSLTVTPTLTAGAANFAISGAVTIAAMGSNTITVTPNTIPANTVNVSANGYGGTLSIRSVGGPIDETRVVALNQTARGAILAFTPASLSRSATGTSFYKVANTGNLDATFTVADTTPHSLAVSSSSNRSSPGPLAGATLTGRRFIFLAAADDPIAGLRRVTFVLDGRTIATDSSAPYDASGTRRRR